MEDQTDGGSNWWRTKLMEDQIDLPIQMHYAVSDVVLQQVAHV